MCVRTLERTPHEQIHRTSMWLSNGTSIKGARKTYTRTHAHTHTCMHTQIYIVISIQNTQHHKKTHMFDMRSNTFARTHTHFEFKYSIFSGLYVVSLLVSQSVQIGLHRSCWLFLSLAISLSGSLLLCQYHTPWVGPCTLWCL